MKSLLSLAVIAGLVWLWWRWDHREPPDVTEAVARAKAQSTLEDFCLGEHVICPDYAFKGEETPANQRFKWSYRYENPRVDPPQRIVVLATRKGEVTLEMTAMAPGEGGGASEAAPPP